MTEPPIVRIGKLTLEFVAGKQKAKGSDPSGGVRLVGFDISQHHSLADSFWIKPRKAPVIRHLPVLPVVINSRTMAVL